MKAPLPPLALENALQELANQQKVQGKASLTLSLTEAKALVQHHGATRRQVERTALGVGIVPRRYQRNIGTIGLEGQMILLDATVAVVGCGGLGGWVAEALARMGVGRLVLIDGDVFEEDNLNRQLGCTERTLGALKAQCLAERLEQVNAAVEVRVYVAWLNEHNAEQLLRGAGVVVDALDTLPARFVLQKAAALLGIPMVHGAIAGFTGQVMTIYPGDVGLRALYGDSPPQERGSEVTLGNPAATPMVVASWQAQEVVKVLTHRGQPLRQRMLLLDTESGDVRELAIS